jgi:hypothetical protein
VWVTGGIAGDITGGIAGSITPRPFYALDGPVVGCETIWTLTETDRLAHAGNETATLCFVTSQCMKWEFGGLFIRIV